MAGPAPKTKNWTARENAHKPKGLHLIVRGLVQVTATNKRPELTEAPHVGKTLPLDLTIKDTGGKGLQVLVWMSAGHHKVVSANQYARVEIRWQGKVIASAPVIDDREHGEHLATLTAAANAKYGKAPKRPAPKKAASRKAGKKASAKKAKPAKKAARKKAAKRPAKKSALKRFVRKLVKKLSPRKTSKKAKGKKRR